MDDEDHGDHFDYTGMGGKRDKHGHHVSGCTHLCPMMRGVPCPRQAASCAPLKSSSFIPELLQNVTVR